MYINVCVQGCDTHLTRRVLVLPGPAERTDGTALLLLLAGSAEKLLALLHPSGGQDESKKQAENSNVLLCVHIQPVHTEVVSAHTESAYQSGMPSNRLILRAVFSVSPRSFPGWVSEGLERGGT